VDVDFDGEHASAWQKMKFPRRGEDSN